MSNYIFKVSELKKYQQFLDRLEKSNHAIILHSEDEILLGILSKLLIAKLECKSEKKPCLYCENCQKIMDSNAIDVKVFGEDKSIVVEDSNNIVTDSYVVPYDFKNKYYVLKNFDNATSQAQNKLLKVIEEPQNFDKFILLAKNLDMVLSTIKSRCEIFEVPRFDTEELKQIFNFEVGTGKKVSFGAGYALGNLTKLESVYQDDDFEDVYKLALKTVTNLKSSVEILDYSNEILKFKDKIEMFLEVLSGLYRDLMVLKSGNQNLVQNMDNANILLVISKSISEIAIVNIQKEIQKTKQKIKFNANINLMIDDLLLKILEIKHIC